MAGLPPGCAEVEQRFQTFVSTPPVTNFTHSGFTTDLFDTDIMHKHIEFIKETHALFLRKDLEEEDMKLYLEAYPRRTFFHVISSEAHYGLIVREHGIDDGDDRKPATRTAYRESERALNAWLSEVDRLHRVVMDCLPKKVTAQLIGEQISRQTKLHPDVMKNIMEFADAKDPKRIVLDAAANRGVTMPRGGRGTRRTKRRGTSRRARR